VRSGQGDPPLCGLGASVANPAQNQKRLFSSNFPFKAIQSHSKAFKAIQRLLEKKDCLFFSRGVSVGHGGRPQEGPRVLPALCVSAPLWQKSVRHTWSPSVFHLWLSCKSKLRQVIAS
jgi:hypothetical protein